MLRSLFIFLLLQSTVSCTPSETPSEPILKGSIELIATRPVDGDKIQPSTPIKLAVTVENSGKEPTKPGELNIKYAFAPPLEKEAGSVLFETEKKPLPSLAPGEKVTLSFETSHALPSLPDFIRDDWALREYQAIATVEGKDYNIGTLALTFSSYYYPAIRKTAALINSSQDSTERGQAESKRSGLNEELMAKAMGDEEDRSGKAAAGRVSDELMIVAGGGHP